MTILWRHLADYSTWIHKAYALTRQLQGQTTILARNTSGDSAGEHSDSSPITSPKDVNTVGVFSFNDLEKYSRNSELFENVINLRKCVYRSENCTFTFLLFVYSLNNFFS